MARNLVYQMYPISWEYDSKKNALVLMTEHLSRVKALGADYVWLSPVYPSPRCDHGYDISDYKNVDSRFGTMKDLDAFIAKAHSLGIKVLMDLVLNHTSTEHPWFKQRKYYCTSATGREGWRNLFDGGPAWERLPEGRWYLHLFHKGQADLNWFDGNRINEDLVNEFRDIVDFWCDHSVDGFRLDIPQAINKDFRQKDLELSDLLFGDGQDVEVINAVFEGHEDLFLIMECIDPTNGELVEYYANSTPVNYVMDISFKESETQWNFVNSMDELCQDSQYMLDVESHDSPRFLSRTKMSPEEVIWRIFNSEAEGICLYQGQELCLKNPTKKELPDKRMLELDTVTAMRAARGESLEVLRKTSRANARIPIPMDEYARQEQNPSSYLNLTKEWIGRWKEKGA